MPALQPCAGAVEIQAFHVQNGRTWSVRSFWGDSLATAWSVADLTLLAGAWGGGWGASFVTSMHTSVTYTGHTVTDLTSASGNRVEQTASVAGTQSGTATPLNVAAVVKFQIARRYRGGKPKIFVAGWTDVSLNDETTWKGSFVTGLTTAWTAVQNAMDAVVTSRSSPVEQINVSRFTGHVERVPATRDTITGHSVESRICTRRKRLPKIAG